MRIERLLTLAEFIELITLNNGEEWTNKDVIEYSEKYMETDLVVCAIPELIVKYNDFLKQPLIKEMFINPVNKEHDCKVCNNTGSYYIGGFFGGSIDVEKCDCEYMHKLIYEEAEKKVIFKVTERDFNYYKRTGMLIIKYKGDNYKLGYTPSLHADFVFYNESLHDLAEATKGKMKLKNVKL